MKEHENLMCRHAGETCPDLSGSRHLAKFTSLPDSGLRRNDGPKEGIFK